MSDVSIVVPIFNGAGYLPAFFDSLLGALPPSSQLILVDDASTEPVFEFVPAMPSDVDIVTLRNERNVGYAATVNRGAASATGDILVQLNTDLVLRSDTIDHLVRVLDDNARAGVVGSKLVYPTTGLIQHVGIGFGAYTNFHALIELPASHPLAAVDRRVQAATAACCAMPLKTYRELGGLDEQHFNCDEDLDLCLRADAAGHLNYVCADAVAYHWQSLSGPTRFARTKSSHAAFWAKWGSRYRVDLDAYLVESLAHVVDVASELARYDFELLNLTRSADDVIAIDVLRQWWPSLESRTHEYRQTANLDPTLRLPLLLPHWMLNDPRPFIYLVDSYRQLADNVYWFDRRRSIVRDELVVDLSGIALTTSEVVGQYV